MMGGIADDLDIILSEMESADDGMALTPHGAARVLKIIRELEARIEALEGRDMDAKSDGYEADANPPRDRSGDDITAWLREEASEWEPDDPDYLSPMGARLREAANIVRCIWLAMEAAKEK